MKPEQLFKVIEFCGQLGERYHILKRGIIPSSLSVTDFDIEEFESFIQYVRETYRWNEQDYFMRKLHASGEKVHKNILLHLTGHITIWNSGQKEAKLLYDPGSHQETLTDLKHKFKNLQQKKSTHAIGLIRDAGGHLDVAFSDYFMPDHSLIRYLGHDTERFYQTMIQNLNMKNGSGLYLLYGKPGTGKTSFIKDVLSKTSKQALFISPFFTESLTSPHLISLLMEYPNSILVIEDAETVLMERKADNSSAVSNLLNLTDGFLADFLNLKIICTFNTELNNIDGALLREGRLKEMHEFTKIPPERAEKIAGILGKQLDSEDPMTLAEICASERSPREYKSKKIGFNSRALG